jgi:hypothetical protein
MRAIVTLVLVLLLEPLAAATLCSSCAAPAPDIEEIDQGGLGVGVDAFRVLRWGQLGPGQINETEIFNDTQKVRTLTGVLRRANGDAACTAGHLVLYNQPGIPHLAPPGACYGFSVSASPGEELVADVIEDPNDSLDGLYELSLRLE